MKNKLKILNLILILVFLFNYTACSNPKTSTETTSVITTVTDAKAKEDTLDYSKDILVLNDKINSITVENTSLERNELLIQIDDFTKRSVSGNGFSSSIYSLIKIRLDQALKEISTIKYPGVI
ncbi:MAG: hypothetical protein FJW63_09035 [Actinobacteria bacterium]|nr:hypothetical protein [Actinomycetota bacterium]